MDDTEYVVIVDDQIDVLDVIGDSLQYFGYQTFCTTDPTQAIQFVDQHRVILLLTDLVMPGMSGEELVECILAHHPGIKVLLMTGYAQHSPDYPVLYKPFRMDDLLCRIQTLQVL